MKVLARIVALVLALIAAAPLDAATNFPTVGAGDGEQMVFTLNRQYTTSTTNVVKFQLAYKAQVIGVSATARASGGSTPTLTVDVKEGGVTILSAPISITAGTVAEGTVSDNQLADESTVTVDLTIGGGSPTWDDITVTLTLVRM